MKKHRPLCPKSATPGKPVRERTVRALIEQGRQNEIGACPWLVCEAPDCEVTYFTPTGSAFTKDDLTVRVGFKETHAPRPVCYCFGHSRESIQQEILETGESTVFDSITARIQAGECSCETLNPKGTCCLGDVRTTVREILAETADDPCCSSGPRPGILNGDRGSPSSDCCAVGPNNSTDDREPSRDEQRGGRR